MNVFELYFDKAPHYIIVSNLKKKKTRKLQLEPITN